MTFDCVSFLRFVCDQFFYPRSDCSFNVMVPLNILIFTFLIHVTRYTLYKFKPLTNGQNGSKAKREGKRCFHLFKLPFVSPSSST